MKWFKKAISQPDWRTQAVQELEEARQALLRSETALDWAQANCDYNYNRIERLEKRLKDEMQSNVQSGQKLQGV
jgi:hypothetical protein